MFNNSLIEQLPEFQQVSYRKLDKNAVWVVAVNWMIFFMILMIMLTFAYLFTPLMETEFALLPVVGLIILMTLSFSLIFYSFKFKGYALREFDIIYKSGIFWRKQTVLPFNRIQHLESHRGPLERKFGLATLRLFSAGGHGADLTIFGLEYERANDIRQLLLDKIQADQAIIND